MSERSPLEIEIRRRIATAGPMPVAEYMALCLLDRQHGYYVTRDPLGARGDFTTAPEVSQMFGELIGLWAATVWTQMGTPENVRLIELGPGAGPDGGRVVFEGPPEALASSATATAPYVREALA